MAVKRCDLIRYLEASGFRLLCEGAKNSVYTNGTRTLPVKRHASLDRTAANELCKQAGLPPEF